MMDELLMRMQYEPAVLLFGTDYKKIKKEVLNYNWSAVVTTNCDLGLSASLKNDDRNILEVYDKKNMQSNLMDRRNLHIIRLFGECLPDNTDDELIIEDIKAEAVAKLAVVSEIIKRNGIVLIEDFEEQFFSHKEIRRAFNELYDNQKQIYIFNCKNKDRYITSLESKGIVVFIDQSINDYFLNNFSTEDDFELLRDKKSVQLYIETGKQTNLVNIEKRALLETDSFASLLNIDLINDVKIPSSMYKEYFYTFLKNSAREPQWFGYNYGFNIRRGFEDDLYKCVKKGLDNVGNPNNKPLLVVGQTGTGKSISLAALAYRIFNEKSIPVVFINDPDINFYSSSEYKQHEVRKKGSIAFRALDTLLEKLENMGAKAVLLIWDTSSYSTGREKSYRLYQALLARGRKVFLVSSAYELNDALRLEESDEEYNEDAIMNRKFSECRATVELSTEGDQLRDILLKKCKLSEKEVERIFNYSVSHENNYLSMFYRTFEILRDDLSKGVYKEASANLDDLDKLLIDNDLCCASINNSFGLALKKIEYELITSGIINKLVDNQIDNRTQIKVAIDDFVRCIAVCSQFKIKMPYDFALRILGTYNGKIIQTLTRSTFFVISKDYYDNYEISIRTPIEAKMYIEAKNMTPLDEVDCIVKMLNMMNPVNWYGQQQEVRLCEKIIILIGPNNLENRNKYKIGHERIIKALKDLRIQRNIWEPILITQEITYMREIYGRNEELEDKERISILNEAIEIADDALKIIENTGVSVGIRNSIIVESANSKLLLCSLKGSNDALLFKQLRRDLRVVIRYDNMNYHAYVTLLKGSITEYRNEEDSIKKIELLESMCSVADELVFENPDISSSEYFQRQVSIIYSYLSDTNVFQSYIDELAANGSAAGLYVYSRKILRDNEVDFGKNISTDLQMSACKKICELFNDDRYKTVLEESESCQYMYLNIIWLMNNKSPIISKEQCMLTRMNIDTWKELLKICNNYINKFCSNLDNTYQMARNIRYMKALCLGQLGQYSDSLSTLREIEEDSTLGIRRILTKHMLCDENGTPIKFIGRLGKYDESQRRGYIYIEEFGKTPIYYFGPNLKTSNFTEGTVFDDIEIGYGDIAPKAYRNIENKE